MENELVTLDFDVCDYLAQQQLKRERGTSPASSLVGSLDASQRNVVKILLSSRRGQNELRKALGIQHVAECSKCPVDEEERRLAICRAGRTAELFKKENL